MKKDVTLLLQFINLALCGGWTYYDILNDSIPFEPIIVFISVAVGLVLAGKKKESTKNKSKTQTSQPKILGSNDRKTNPKEIVGRKGLLKELRTTMQKQGKVALINGMGGIGKTTLAEVYVYQYGPKYDHILWVEQTSKQLEDDFISDRTLLENLKIKDAAEDKQELFRQVIQKLNLVEETNNLLIIDNAEEGLERYLDQLPGHPHWHLLATSRYHMDDMHEITLDFLSEKEAIQLFNQECEEKLDQNLVKELVAMVENHTLSITLLAKSARHYDSDLERLKTVFEEDLQTKVYLKHAKDKVDKVKAYLISIFDLNNLTEDQIWILQQFVCLPPDYYDHDWLKDWIKPEDQRANHFNLLLSELSDQGWLISRKLHVEQWKLHRLIREVILDKHAPVEENILPLISSIISLLDIDDIKDNPVDKFQWIPYGTAINEQFGDSEHHQIALLQNNLALRLKDLGDFEGAKRLLERALASDEKNFGTDHPKTTESYFNLAIVLGDLGDFKGAKVLLEQAVASAEEIFGSEHAITANRYSSLAMALIELGDFERAKGLLEKASASDEKNFGTQHSTTAASYSKLALVLQELGDYLNAKDLLQRGMASAEKNFGTDHPNTARSYSNLAMVLWNLGEYHDAKVLLEKAMTLAEKNFGIDHPITAESYSNLALVLQDLGDYPLAKEFLEKAMTLAEKILGTDHPNTAISYTNLAMVLRRLGEYHGAKKLLEKAVSLGEKKLGTDHPTTAMRYSNLASVLWDLGDFERAHSLAEKALSVFMKVLPKDHPNIQTVKGNMAVYKANLKK